MKFNKHVIKFFPTKTELVCIKSHNVEQTFNLHRNDQLLVAEKLPALVRLLLEERRHVADAADVVVVVLGLAFVDDVGQVRLEDLHVVLHALVDGPERGDELERGGADDGADAALHREGLDVVDHLHHVVVVVVEAASAHDAPDHVQRRQVEEPVHLDGGVLEF